MLDGVYSEIADGVILSFERCMDKPIETIWAVLSVDEHGEGICGAQIHGRWMSLTTADEALLQKALIPAAREIANLTGKKLKLVKFTARQDIGNIIPDGSGRG